MKIDLVFVDSFETSFNGKNYKIYQFLDPKSLTIISGTDLKNADSLQVFESYSCKLGVKGGKLKVLELL